jgi:type I restriction enzyme M protein
MSPFNSAKYKALLKGLDCQVVPFSQLERTKRIDAEYFNKTHVQVATLLQRRRTQSVADAAKISDGNHFTISEHFVEEGIPYYRGQDVVGNFFIELSAPTYITEQAFRRPFMLRSHLQKGDVLLSIIGTIGQSSIVSDSSPATCSCKLAILRPREVQPEYLATFLRSSYGRSQIERLTRGAVQMGILLEDMDQLVVARFSPSFEQAVSKCVREAKANFQCADSSLADAEETLLHALGLTNWQPIDTLSCTRRSSEVFNNQRIDAEYYREKFYAAKRRLKDAGAVRFVPLGDLLTTLTNGHTPLHHDLRLGEVPFLCAEHVSNFEIHFDSQKRILLEHHRTELARTALQEGDVLLTIKGKVGNAAMVEALPGQVNINQDVALLRVNDRFPVWFILAFVNSLLGRLQVDQLSTGGINPFLGLANVRRIEIPQLTPKLMTDIAQKAKQMAHEARYSRQQAEGSLTRAKRAIELAIEQDEHVAMAYLSGRED